MAEVFWNSWLEEDLIKSLDDLFDAILLKKETPFPDLIIVPEFKENENILLTSSIPYFNTYRQNDILQNLMDRVLELIPSGCNRQMLIHTDNQEIKKQWIQKYSFCRFLDQSHFVEIKKPERHFSPFSTYPAKQDYLKSWFIPEEIDLADQIIPIIPLFPSSIFGIHGVLSSFFWFLPTKIKNEILIQNNIKNRTAAFMEILIRFLPKITLSGLIYPETPGFSVLGNDPASVDSFGSALMSVKSSSVSTTKYCNKHKLCIGDLLKVHVQGERFRKPIVKNPISFKDKFNLLIREESCNLCLKCIELCPFQAIMMVENKMMYKKNHCNQCGYCVAICPKQAILEV